MSEHRFDGSAAPECRLDRRCEPALLAGDVDPEAPLFRCVVALAAELVGLVGLALACV
jgi:hypothetical protein